MNHTTSTTDIAAWGKADAELEALASTIWELITTSAPIESRTYAKNADRQERLALLYAREAGWWTVLRKHTPTYVARVYRVAAIKAHALSARRAQECRESAREWRRFVEQSQGGAR